MKLSKTPEVQDHPTRLKPLRTKLREEVLQLLFGGEVSLTRYTAIERAARRFHRQLFPVPKSPWTNEPIDDVTKVDLVPPKDLMAFFARCLSLLGELKGDDLGDYLEFGVFNGSSMASLSHALSRSGLNMRRFGFDGFQGLPEGSDEEDGGVWQAGFYQCSFSDMQRGLRNKGVNPDFVNWISGWYDETLCPELVEEHGIQNVGIAFVDCDTYSSAKTVLDFLAPLIDQPAILVFDDWKLNDLDIEEAGEYRAFNEFLGQNPHLQATEIGSYSRKSKAFLLTSKSL